MVSSVPPPDPSGSSRAFPGTGVEALADLSATEAAARALVRPVRDPEERATWAAWLDATSRPAYLGSLDDEGRGRWGETVLRVLDALAFGLGDLFEQRVAVLGTHPLFVERGGGAPRTWSYEKIARRIERIAATLLRTVPGRAPRVALFADNGVEGACCDLACLCHGIVVAPLSVHFDGGELAWILDRLDVDLVITDTDERVRRLFEVRARAKRPFEILALEPGSSVDHGRVRMLEELSAALSPAEIGETLAAHSALGFDDPCTVMFTSGSTGHPKGVVFSQRNLVTKRFLRAAALPQVGEDEVLLCYLPLFHTFGRFLELLGTIFWRGTYVFVGNPSAEALLAALPEVAPTGLISIPLRWSQIQDRVQELGDAAATEAEREAAFRRVVGERLRWGLSAAGYLHPKTFRFFQGRGVALASGFGMTEATGGITMSPPGDYLDDSVGKPLPGMRLKLTAEGEMWIAGPYVARYLDADGKGLTCEPRVLEDGEEWLPTGDLFRELGRGHLSIVDRLKDIYKNDRGQTIAPRRVERALEEVAGVKRAFLVGDGRSWNVLLLVPDRDDPVLAAMGSRGEEREYFQRIVVAANHNLAPFERAIDFAVLERDFEEQRGELTPKQTYRRKAIEANFEAIISELYRTSRLQLEVRGTRVRIPAWVLRDLEVLEQDLVAESDALVDRRRNLRLPLARVGARTRVGNLEYLVEGDVVDLGLFARQPLLWLGNPALVAFLPCKEGWDVPHRRVDGNAVLVASDVGFAQGPPPKGVRRLLQELHATLAVALFRSGSEARDALRTLARQLEEIEQPLPAVIRARLVSLSRHPYEALRCLAYQTLLLGEPGAGDDERFAAFLESGLPFLSEDSLHEIAAASLGPRRLEALRRRLAHYRGHLAWPADDVVRRQLEHVFRMLVDFVHRDPYYYAPVRVELASWALLGQDSRLARYAGDLLFDLVAWFENGLDSRHVSLDREEWERCAVFDDEIHAATRERVYLLIARTSFLEQAVILVFEDETFTLQQIAPRGLWVSRIQIHDGFQLLRLSVNTLVGRHYDLLVNLRGTADAEADLLTNYWMLSIGGYALGPRTLPRFGCSRPEFGAMALEHIRDLNAEERIRALASSSRVEDVHPVAASDWRRLYVRAMETFFRGWDHSGGRIVPGRVAPVNVVVPEQDFREDPVLLSLAGWEPYGGPLSLVAPMITDFYQKARAQAPGVGSFLRVEWIFDACREALPPERAQAFLEALQAAVPRLPESVEAQAIAEALPGYRARMETEPWVPLAVDSAVARYFTWNRVNPAATAAARLDFVESLVDLYRLDRYGEIARYQLFRATLFAAASATVREAFARLIEALHREPQLPALRRVELSDLQNELGDDDERTAFRRLAFPRGLTGSRPEIITFGDAEHRRVAVLTRVFDRRGAAYEVREPVEPGEIGLLYRLFFRRRFPKKVGEFDQHLLCLDDGGRIVAGVCYQRTREDAAHMDGVVVVPSLEGRGLATVLLDDFCRRLASGGVEVVQTGFFMRAFCEKRGFVLHPRWSGLVRFLGDEG